MISAFDLAKYGLSLCITDTKGSHADLTDDYAAIRAEMEQVAALFGKKVLREVDEEDFYASIPMVREQAGDRAVLRCLLYTSSINTNNEKQPSANEKAEG